MIPDYSSSFDIIISSDDNADPGAITDCVTNDPKDCSTHLVGKSASPGAQDDTDPWPPYEDKNYIYSNYDGDDPSTANGQRTFQPFWTDFVPSTPMGEIKTGKTENVKTIDEKILLAPLEIGADVKFPGWIDDGYTSMPAGGGEGLPVSKRVEAKALSELVIAEEKKKERRHARAF